MDSISITLDNPDSCGKTTQADLLSEKATQLGHDVQLTHDVILNSAAAWYDILCERADTGPVVYFFKEPPCTFENIYPK